MSGADRVESLLDALTLDEQVSLLAGDDFWHTVAVPRLGIPAMRVSDGPVGARGTEFGGGPPSMCAPCGTLLAATWDPALVEQVGQVLGRELRAKGASVLLAPTVNLHRTPVGGRNFECLSEDPHLSARMAVGYVTGVQSQGVACCIKHFVGNDTELERMTVDSRIDERTLRELYLVPFEAAVTEAGVMAIMTAYNRINGPWSADSVELLEGVARQEWGFDGLFMSDWFGLHSTDEAITAGLDLEMPGPTRNRGQLLVDAVTAGRVPAGAVRRAAGNVLRLMERTGALDAGGPGPETARLDGPEVAADLALLGRAAAAGMVLVANRGPVLPLHPETLGRVAVIGPNAAVGQVMGGGSAHVTPTRVAHLLDSLQARLRGHGVEVVHAPGVNINRRLPELDARLRGPVDLAIFDSPEGLDRAGAAPVTRSVIDALYVMWVKDPLGNRNPNPSFGARLSTTVTPDRSGQWRFGLESVAPTRILVDGRLLIDNAEVPIGGSFFGTGKGETTGSVELEAGRSYELVVEVRHHPTGFGMGGVYVGALGPLESDQLARAVTAGAEADVSVLVVGTNDDWECEGWDRTTLALPGDQDELISRVAAASRRTVVVVNAGSPVAMPWLSEVDAVLLCWFPGQEMGEALTDVLLGVLEPGGRLPVTFPASLDDTPTVEHYPGRNGVAEYREGRLVGHRWYDTVGREPLFPFGFGLGYADIAVTTAALAPEDGAGGARAVDVLLANRAGRDGTQVVQVYVAPTSPVSGDEPALRLVGFTKVTVPAGSTVPARVVCDPRATSTWDVARHAWVEATGPFELRIGTSSRQLPFLLPLD
jgi:beta-glucosidase